MQGTPDPSEVLASRLADGDIAALADVLSEHRERLVRMVEVRTDPRVRSRIDPEDVLQQAYVEAVKRIKHFSKMECRSSYIWLRAIVLQTLIDLHRAHLSAKARDASRDMSLHARRPCQSSSASLSQMIVSNATSPSGAAVRAEVATAVARALDKMDDGDREVLVLRHFEELTNSETAEVLGVGQKAASMRYTRAIRRLREALSELASHESDHDSLC